jgi:hypothetical protein
VDRFSPLYVCHPCASGGGGKNGSMTMHESAVKAHIARWHGPTMPACLRMLTELEHATHGWGVDGYPEYITLGA